MNSYPFLNNKHKPVFTSDLADIVPRVRKERIIDITNSPVVPAPSLRAKLELLHRAGELDGGLPIVRDGILVGLIPAPDLEYALDNLRDEANSLCLMAPVQTIEDSDGEDGVDPTDFTPYIDPVSSPLLLVHSLVLPRRFGRVDLMLIFGNIGTSCVGYQVADGSGVRVFRQVGVEIHLCAEGWAVCRHGKFPFSPPTALRSVFTNWVPEQTHKKTFAKYMRELEEKEGRM